VLVKAGTPRVRNFIAHLPSWMAVAWSPQTRN